MALFTVSSIIDGDTFEVQGGWTWEGQTGTRVRPTGFDAAELRAPGGRAAKDSLRRLILGRQVELRRAHRVDRGRLVCDVYLQGRNLADYFSG
ncbi:MAG: thermonuclease family protein [Armatimonadia bacterium]|nr:thermonuclease family protein [Armatimonadia bacterium]